MPVQLPFEIRISKKNPLTWSKVLPKFLQDYRIGNTPLFYYEHKRSGHIIVQEIYRNGSSAWLNHYLVRSASSFHLKSNLSGVMLYYSFSGSVEYLNKASHNRCSGGQFNMIPDKSFHHEVVLNDASSSFLLFIPDEVLKKFERTFPLVNFFLSKITTPTLEENTIGVIKDDGRLNTAIMEILHSEHHSDSILRQMSKIIDKIITISLDLATTSLVFNKTISRLDKNGISGLKNVRKELLNNLCEWRPPALSVLARLALMSEKKLEDIFKATFNITMFDFYQNARMEEIYRDLCEYDSTLPEIAEHYNYRDYSSFSAAVKKRFGKSPREIRKLEYENQTALENINFEYSKGT